MSAQLLEKLTSLGKEMGYTGVELREWVTAQAKVEESKNAAALERDAVALEREERRLCREQLQQEIAAKAELAREEAKAESARIESERSERLRLG